MTTLKVPSERPYNIIAAVIFLLGLGMFSYMGVYMWLPTLFLVTGIAVIVRQALQAHKLDVIVAFIVFGAAFFASFLQFFSRVFLPTFLMIGTVYYILRQFFPFKKHIVLPSIPPVVPPSVPPVVPPPEPPSNT